jgi:hypothetical protein
LTERSPGKNEEYLCTANLRSLNSARLTPILGNRSCFPKDFRVAISNSRLIACDERGVTFRWKDYRAHGSTRYKTMTLRTDEFMRRFLLHVLPSGFHRIRHYGLLANANRKTQIATARELLHQPAPKVTAELAHAHAGCGSVRPTFVCRHCGAPMLIIETFARAQYIRGPPGPARQP